MISWLVENIGGWVFGLIICAIFVGICWLLGQSGKMMRQGVLNSKLGYILLPLMGWLAVYVLLFLWLPALYFMLSLLALIPVAMGFFGYFFTMGSDG
ncbi:MAG: hypothetical protein WCF57_08570 [Pyrinomonadaceae bacterium]